MSKLRRDLSVVLAGACCGLFGVSVFLLADRVNSYYAYLGWLQEGPSDFRYDRGVETLSWVPVVLWHMVLSVTAALMVHRYQANSRVSPFLRWQAIGLVSLFGWGATILAIVGAETLAKQTFFVGASFQVEDLNNRILLACHEEIAVCLVERDALAAV